MEKLYKESGINKYQLESKYYEKLVHILYLFFVCLNTNI